MIKESVQDIGIHVISLGHQGDESNAENHRNTFSIKS
jgi:hypothetical protein